MPVLIYLRAFLSRYATGIHSYNVDLHPPPLRLDLPFPLSPSYQKFINEFPRLSLFHGAVEFLSLHDERATIEQGFLRIAHTHEAEFFLSAEGAVYWSSSSEFLPILFAAAFDEALMAICETESLLYTREGEFADVFDAEGEIRMKVRQRQVLAGLKAAPSSAFYDFEKAVLALANQQTEQAIHALETAIQKDPQAAPCLQMLASLYEQQEQFEQAKNTFAQLATARGADACHSWLEASRLSSELSQKHDYLRLIWTHTPQYPHDLLDKASQTLNSDIQATTKYLSDVKLLLEVCPEGQKKLAQSVLDFEKKLKMRTVLKKL